MPRVSEAPAPDIVPPPADGWRQPVGPIPMLLTGAGFWLTLLAFGVLRLVDREQMGWSILGLILGMVLGLTYQLRRKRPWARQAERLEAFVRDDPVLGRRNPARLSILGLMIWTIVVGVRWLRARTAGKTSERLRAGRPRSQ